MEYPEFYFYKGKVSDRDWILTRMEAVPDRFKDEVSRKYVKLFFSSANGRKLANTYLQNTANEYRQLKYKEQSESGDSIKGLPR